MIKYLNWFALLANAILTNIPQYLNFLLQKYSRVDDVNCPSSASIRKFCFLNRQDIGKFKNSQDPRVFQNFIQNLQIGARWKI